MIDFSISQLTVNTFAEHSALFPGRSHKMGVTKLETQNGDAKYRCLKAT